MGNIICERCGGVVHTLQAKGNPKKEMYCPECWRLKQMKDKYKDKKVILKTRHVEPFSGGFCDWYGTDKEAVVTFVTMKKYLYSKWEEKCVSMDHSVCEHEGENYPDLVPAEEEGLMKLPDSCHPDKVIDHSNFGLSDVKSPGAYLDGLHYDEEESVDEAYTIIVPFDVLTKPHCKQGLEQLNEKYDRNFKLKTGEENEKNMD